jgi:hypothetical protein
MSFSKLRLVSLLTGVRIEAPEAAKWVQALAQSGLLSIFGFRR